MGREVVVGAGQLGPVQRDHTRADVVERLMALLRRAAGLGVELVVFPELALTTFFPRWWITDPAELDAWYETELPGPETKPLWDEAARLGVGFVLGVAEKTPEGRRFNTSILVGPDGVEMGRYRKIHLPGHRDHEPWRAFQHLEKRYFEVGDLGFPAYRTPFAGIVGMLLCNDRRWPEAYRMLGLQGVELVCIGYNTPVHNPPAPEQDQFGDFHNHLVMQGGAYQNATFVVGVAKAGTEEGVDHIGGSAIIAPSGAIVARCTTLGDELAVAVCDLDLCRSYATSVFDLAAHRQPDQYGLIVERRGVVPPA